MSSPQPKWPLGILGATLLLLLALAAVYGFNPDWLALSSP